MLLGASWRALAPLLLGSSVVAVLSFVIVGPLAPALARDAVVGARASQR